MMWQKEKTLADPLNGPNSTYYELVRDLDVYRELSETV